MFKNRQFSNSEYHNGFKLSNKNRKAASFQASTDDNTLDLDFRLDLFSLISMKWDRAMT